MFPNFINLKIIKRSKDNERFYDIYNMINENNGYLSDYELMNKIIDKHFSK
jgi:hypothetical protein